MPRIAAPTSDTTLRKAAPRPNTYRISDGSGLYMLVEPNGSKLWRFDYTFQGKRKTIAFGPYPDVGLADARIERDKSRKFVAAGIDPSVHRQQEKIASEVAAANTYGLIVEEYLTDLEDELRASTMSKKRRLLTVHAAALKSRPMAKIISAEIFTICKNIERKGQRETAHNLRDAIGQFFRWAVVNHKIESDPTPALRGSLKTVKVVGRAAITDPQKLGGLLRCIWDYDGWPTLTACMKMQALCFQRPGEIRTMEWSELNFRKAMWSIPEHKMKMGRPHDVPLSPQAIIVLKEIKRMTGNCKFVFPSLRKESRPLSENATNSALRRMGFMKHEHSSHGFRATASTILNGLKKDSRVIERHLAHLEPNETKRAYDRAEYWPERVELSNFWADYLDELRVNATALAVGGTADHRFAHLLE